MINKSSPLQQNDSHSSDSRTSSDSDSKIDKGKGIFLEMQKKNHINKKSKVLDLIGIKDALQSEEPTADLQVGQYDNKNEEKNCQHIHLNIFTKQQHIKIQDDPSILPVLVQIKSMKQNMRKSNIDLIFVVDVSGSMRGKKINLVKNSLRYVQKILNEDDRIALITFANQAGINLPWTRNTIENKKKIKKSILDIKIRDSTNIAKGVELGLRMIKERQYRNPVTCMFVLSDGKDNYDGADQRVKIALELHDIQDNINIHTFGYGTKHDPKVMSNIANLKGGKFSFIDKIERVPEHFVLAMCGILSIKAKNVKLIVESNNENFKIKKVFGDDYLWGKLGNNKYEMNLNYLQNGEQKEFALELELQSSKQIETEQVKILEVKLTGQLIEQDYSFIKEQNLMMEFTNQDVQILQNEIVEVNFLRGKAGDQIGQAKELANQQLYDQAQQLLNQMILEIEASPFQKTLAIVLLDLLEVKEICKPKIYNKKGEAIMMNKQRNHIQRQRSINNSEEWDSNEEKTMQQLRNGKLQLSDSESDREDLINKQELDENFPNSENSINSSS